MSRMKFCSQVVVASFVASFARLCAVGTPAEVCIKPVGESGQQATNYSSTERTSLLRILFAQNLEVFPKTTSVIIFFVVSDVRSPGSVR